MSVTATMDQAKHIYIPLKRPWYDLICQHNKTIEYRAASNFWRSRFATGTHCVFQWGLLGTVCDHSSRFCNHVVLRQYVARVYHDSLCNIYCRGGGMSLLGLFQHHLFNAVFFSSIQMLSIVNCRFHLFDLPQHHLINDVFFIIQMLSIVVFICLIRRNITFLIPF